MELGATDASRRVELEADVAIVGSGAGGSVMAAKLAERGFSVVLIEEGGHHKTEEFDSRPTRGFRKLYRDAGLSAMLGKPNIGFAEGRCVGGSTVVNGGMSWKTPDRILADWVAEGLPAIGPEAMAPHFAAVEERIHVANQSEASIGKDSRMFKEGAEKLGYRMVDNLRNQHDCLGSNNCIFGCPNRAKRSALVTWVPDAMAAGTTLVHGCRIERILMAGNRAIGLAGHFVDQRSRPVGKSFVVRANVVVSSCGAAQSPALLMRSGLKSRELGRNLWIHPNVKAIGVFNETIESWKGVHQAYQLRSFENEGLVFAAANVPPGFVALSMETFGDELGDLMARYNEMIVGGILVEDSHAGRVRLGPGGQPLLFYDLNDTDMRQFVRGVSIMAEIYLSMGAERVITPFQEMPEVRSPRDVQTLRAGRLDRSRAEIFTVHLMGTCRMGVDPAKSVTDAHGRVHDTENVFVSDASIFPGPIGVNPMETIMALSLRNAESVARVAERGRRARFRGWRAPIEGWTYDALAAADTGTLEDILRSGTAPDEDRLDGWEFKGYNPPFFARILGIRKFLKGFERREEGLFGYNLAAVQNAIDEPWLALPRHEHPKRFGWYRCERVMPGEKDDLYPTALLLDYGRGGNRFGDPTSLLRDYLVQVAPENPDLLLGKAYLAIGPGRVFSNFFLLERLRKAPAPLAAR